MRTSRLLTSLKLGMIGLMTCAASLSAADRVALVVGVGDYQHNVKLANPANDAKSIAKMLTQIGFQVTLLVDVGTEDFYEGIDKFKRDAMEARVGLFYFAGHGVEVEKRNYLLPVDAKLERQSQLRTQAISLESVLSEMKKARLPAKMLILDCCRNNPLKRSWILKRGTGGGLAALGDADMPPATMILFAAAPGQEALDGEGNNSPFTKALIAELAVPNRNALEAFYAVSDRVVKSTGKRQEPWVKVDGAGRTFRQFKLAVDDSKPAEKKMTPPAPTSNVAKPEIKRPPGEKLVNHSEITLLWCPPGKFTMGDPDLEIAPPRQVTLSKGFWLGQHEITRNEYREVMKMDALEHYPDPGDDSPVDKISWDDVGKFCQRLTQLERAAGSLPDGFEYALPSEAQWEYACRAGSTSAFSFGDDLTLKQANFRFNESGMIGMSNQVEDPDESGRGRLIVTGVNKGSPAEKAGVKSGDRILEIDGQEFDHDVTFTAYAMQKKQGESIELKLERDGKPLRFSIEMESLREVLKQGGFTFVGNQGTEKGRNLGRPAVFGTYPPNPWGFTEMHGNVQEWCGDWYGTSSNTPATDPTGESKGKGRCMKGGHWTGPEQGCRAGWRSYMAPRVEIVASGFRVALVPKGSMPWISGDRSLTSRTRIVPDQYTTIQEALDDANNGDTVLVKEGIYRETIQLYDWKDIEIRGENPSTTILRVEDPGKNLIESSRVDRYRLSNLTLELVEADGSKMKNGSPQCLMLLTSNSTVTVRDCIFRGGSKMYGIAQSSGNSLVSHCLFESCRTGMMVSGKDSIAAFRDNTVNESEGAGVLFQSGANCTVKNNLMQKNKGSGIGVVGETTSANLIQNTCTENGMHGISFAEGSIGAIEGNQCLENTASGIAVVASSPQVEKNICTKNGSFGIIVVKATSKPLINGNTCNENTNNGIGIAREVFPAEFRDNHASGNKIEPQINRKVEFTARE